MNRLSGTAALLLLLSLVAGCTHSIDVRSTGRKVVCLREENIVANNGPAALNDSVSGAGADPQAYRETRVGTGFLVRYRNRPYLVTAAHIARHRSGKTEIIWSTRDGQLKAVSLKDLQSMVDGAHWAVHSRADLAVIPFLDDPGADYISIPGDAIAVRALNEPLDNGATVLGCPMESARDAYSNPITRRARITGWRTTISHPGVDPNLEFIVLDQELTKGYSGAPVFISQDLHNSAVPFNSDRAARLVGVQTMVAGRLDGERISLVLPIDYLMELLP